MVRSEGRVYLFKHGIKRCYRKSGIKRKIRRYICLCKVDLCVIRRSIFKSAYCVVYRCCISVNSFLLSYIKASVNACDCKVESRQRFGRVKSVVRVCTCICLVFSKLCIGFRYFLINNGIISRKIFKPSDGCSDSLGIAVNIGLPADVEVWHNCHISIPHSFKAFSRIERASVCDYRSCFLLRRGNSRIIGLVFLPRRYCISDSCSIAVNLFLLAAVKISVDTVYCRSDIRPV